MAEFESLSYFFYREDVKDECEKSFLLRKKICLTSRHQKNENHMDLNFGFLSSLMAPNFLNHF